MRGDGAPVTAAMLRAKAQDLYGATDLPPDCFSASWTWVHSFLKRHKLSIRRRTRQGQTTPQDAARVSAEFAKEVRQKMEDLQVTIVFNADQTGKRYHCLCYKI